MFFKFDWSGAIVRALEGMIHCGLSNHSMMGLRKTLQANCAPLCVEMGFVWTVGISRKTKCNSRSKIWSQLQADMYRFYQGTIHIFCCWTICIFLHFLLIIQLLDTKLGSVIVISKRNNCKYLRSKIIWWLVGDYSFPIALAKGLGGGFRKWQSF